ncbi:5'-deoxynucleotidase [Zongyangia hominis]|uniref:5'-deoxynucleotidase n=1 Tax=Zongyangia hominis TaxID=2763677 RepID=A0A926EEQ2_9FIRM|nr:5'-deoxynucleotidase [Zongyangia hominis]MBC8570521.1 5'-deoxynucleotidase [Zongyangia hominis]
MGQGNFFAMISRMKYIDRWALMRNTRQENLSEHSLMTAVVAHALCVLGNRRLGKRLDGNRAAVLSLYHDAEEILTGDLPTPVKYDNPAIRDAYQQVERVAGEKLLSMLPEDMRGDYAAIFFPAGEDGYLLRLVKAADKLCALIKCIEEEKAGNTEFSKAKTSIEAAIRGYRLPEADLFLSEFMDGFYLTLDELD